MNVAGRVLLTGLYLLGGVAAGGSLAAVLIEWASDLKCLPPVTNSFGDPMPVENALGHACDLMTYGSGVVCGLCVFIAIAVNCCWHHWWWCLFHQTLTLLMCTFSAACGAALTVDFILWCHTLQNTLGTSASCKTAAKLYDKIHDTGNMTSYFRKMEMQQACQWAVVPLLLCAVVGCACLIRVNSTETHRQGRHLSTSGRYFLLPDESAPLLVAQTPLVNSGPEPRPRTYMDHSAQAVSNT